MRNVGLWGGCAVLLLALGMSAASAAPPSADDDDDDAVPVAGPNPAARPRDGWNPIITRTFGLDKKPAPKPAKEAAKKADAPAPRPSAQEETAVSIRRLEEAKLHRRQDVCLRLREIARETNDDELERKAEELDQRAFEVYMERTRYLPSATSDAEALEPRKKDSTSSTASVREVKP
jgi:hypothetical protein